MDLRKRKLKVKLFVPTPRRHMVWGSRGILHLFINSALDGSDRVMEDKKKTILESTAQSGPHNSAPFPAGDHVACIGKKCKQNFDWEI